MIKLGPLYEKRKLIVDLLQKIPIETGDIIFNAADVAGPFGIPFSKLIQKFTNSPYSHATVMYVENEEIYAIDVSDYGTRKLRLIDWFDDWRMKDFCVYRLKHKTVEIENCLKKSINLFLHEDPSYDFTFNNSEKFYCTESVSYIYNLCGINLGGAFYLKEILPWWFYQIVWLGSKITKIFSNASLPTDVPIVIVGNEQKGMRACKQIKKIWTSDPNKI